jgi:hypothetical protein
MLRLASVAAQVLGEIMNSLVHLDILDHMALLPAVKVAVLQLTLVSVVDQVAQVGLPS